jgi:hypothetical protein
MIGSREYGEKRDKVEMRGRKKTNRIDKVREGRDRISPFPQQRMRDVDGRNGPTSPDRRKKNPKFGALAAGK